MFALGGDVPSIKLTPRPDQDKLSASWEFERNARSRCLRTILGSNYIQSNSTSEERTIALGRQPQCLVCRDCNNLKNIRHRLDRIEELSRSNDGILPSCRITLGVLSKILMVHVYDRPVCSCGEASQSQDPNLEEVV